MSGMECKLTILSAGVVGYSRLLEAVEASVFASVSAIL